MNFYDKALDINTSIGDIERNLSSKVSELMLYWEGSASKSYSKRYDEIRSAIFKVKVQLGIYIIVGNLVKDLETVEKDIQGLDTNLEDYDSQLNDLNVRKSVIVGNIKNYLNDIINSKINSSNTYGKFVEIAGRKVYTNSEIGYF